MKALSSAGRTAVFAAAICGLTAVEAQPQALTNLSSVRVGYNTRKATVAPEGALKTTLDALEREIAAATRAGRNGEVRRLYAKGLVLLSGREWTDALDFSNSLVLRTDRLVVDPARPYLVRLEQIYAPAIELPRPLVVKPTLRRPLARGRGGNAAGGAARGGTPGATAAAATVKTFPTLDGISRDLRESPEAIELDLAGLADGTYEVAVEVLDGATSLATATLTIAVRGGIDQTVARLEAAAQRAPEAVRASILYPIDRMKNVNRGLLTLTTFNAERDFAAAEEVATAAAVGADPFAARTGDFERHHLLASANEIMPYRVYVPKSYKRGTPAPLILALHGLGQTEDSWFTAYGDNLLTNAEQRGYIVASPLGYRVDGFYGWGVGEPPSDPDDRRLRQRSEDDVMQVLKLMREHYTVDLNRIYLMGHSMGGIGTWTLAPKFPDIWAAIAPFAGRGVPATLERIKHIPEIVIHGDGDATVNVEGSRTMVARMKELGIEHRYIEVPGGSHSGVVGPNVPAVFDFFDAHRKK